MSATKRPRSTRDRPAKPPLSEEAIVDAALVILESEGLGAVSMRRVAAALDTGAGSLYVYVNGHEGLVEALFDRIIATIEVETPDPSRWRTQLHSLLERTREVLVAHPGIAAATMVDPPRTLVAMRLLEGLFGTLLAGSLDPQDAAWTADILVAQVTYAAIEAESRHRDATSLAKEVSATFSRIPADEFPLISTHIAELVAGDVDQRCRFAIDVVIEGVLSNEEKYPLTWRAPRDLNPEPED
jgi:AcrR family transcriptional regulator